MTNPLREKKTSDELATMVADELGLSAMFIQVAADPVYGWHPTVMASPQSVIGLQQKAEDAAHSLRERYELSE